MCGGNRGNPGDPLEDAEVIVRGRFVRRGVYDLIVGRHAVEAYRGLDLGSQVRIGPGTFTMGQDGPPADYKVKEHAARFDDADWDERPAHRVTISTA